MSYQFDNDMPIYLQILEHIKGLIISNKYSPNDKLMSVRDMSIEYGVNPNTIQKALAELESLGLIYTERTNGKYVTADTSLINRFKKQYVNEKVQEFFSSMEKMGLSKKDVMDILNKE